MTAKFLIDECLSLALVHTAVRRGYEANHISHLGMTGASDVAVARRAVHGDYTLVTNNGKHLTKIYEGIELHCGLIIIASQVVVPRQIYLFDLAITHCVACEGLVNQVMQVEGSGMIRSWEGGSVRY